MLLLAQPKVIFAQLSIFYRKYWMSSECRGGRNITTRPQENKTHSLPPTHTIFRTGKEEIKYYGMFVLKMLMRPGIGQNVSCAVGDFA